MLKDRMLSKSHFVGGWNRNTPTNDITIRKFGNLDLMRPPSIQQVLALALCRDITACHVTARFYQFQLLRIHVEREFASLSRRCALTFGHETLAALFIGHDISLNIGQLTG